jgi:hypothetical protein
MESQNHNPNYPNMSEFTNNTNKNKIQNAKIKIQNYNLKLKINKIQTPVIASLEVSSTCGRRPDTSRRCPKY